MTSNTHSGHDPAELGELERSILSIVWRLGTVTAEQVREELDRPLKDSTVRTVLRRLEEKGYLAHTLEDRTFSTIPPNRASAWPAVPSSALSIGSARAPLKHCLWAWSTPKSSTAPNCNASPPVSPKHKKCRRSSSQRRQKKKEAKR